MVWQLCTLVQQTKLLLMSQTWMWKKCKDTPSKVQSCTWENSMFLLPCSISLNMQKNWLGQAERTHTRTLLRNAHLNTITVTKTCSNWLFFHRKKTKLRFFGVTGAVLPNPDRPTRPTRPNPDPIPTQSRPNPDPIPTQSRPNPDPLFEGTAFFSPLQPFFGQKIVLFGVFIRKMNFRDLFWSFSPLQPFFGKKKKCPFSFFSEK